MSNNMLTTVNNMKDAEVLEIVSEMDNPKVSLSMIHLKSVIESNPQLTRDDFRNYILKSQSTGANPILDQIYLTTFSGKATIIYSYHFFISKAEATGKYDGFETDDGVGEYLDPKTKKVTKESYAICKVYRKDRARPVVYKAWFPEFAKAYNGKLSGQWASKPMLMITKCAVCNAHKLAFPNEIGFMETEYDAQETIQKEPDNIPREVKEEAITVSLVMEEDVVAEEVVTNEVKPKEEIYLVPFGPFKGKDIKNISIAALKDFYDFVKSEAAKKESVPDQIQLFLDVSSGILDKGVV